MSYHGVEMIVFVTTITTRILLRSCMNDLNCVTRQNINLG
jgi:hypothetical protein